MSQSQALNLHPLNAAVADGLVRKMRERHVAAAERFVQIAAQATIDVGTRPIRALRLQMPSGYAQIADRLRGAKVIHAALAGRPQRLFAWRNRAGECGWTEDREAASIGAFHEVRRGVSFEEVSAWPSSVCVDPTRRRRRR